MALYICCPGDVCRNLAKLPEVRKCTPVNEAMTKIHLDYMGL